MIKTAGGPVWVAALLVLTWSSTAGPARAQSPMYPGRMRQSPQSAKIRHRLSTSSVRDELIADYRYQAATGTTRLP